MCYDLSDAGVKAYRAPPDKYQGWFLSSDDQLNRMWYAGAYTAQMDMVPVGVASCFTVPVIFDGAKRDRAIWSGDLMVTNPVAHALDRAPTASRTSRARSTAS